MSTPDSSQPIEPDNQLPPVEPPNVGFIVKLFVIPAAIVSSMILVWILINWLANMGSDPRVYVEALKRDNAVRWQAAHNLANELHTPAGEQMRREPETGRELGAMLVDEMERRDRPTSGDALNESLKFRVYLCHVLGRFEVIEVLPALLQAATVERQPAEAVVRCAALHALASWIDQAQQSKLELLNSKTQAQLLEVLLAATESDQLYLVREYATYALGVLGGEKAETRLVSLLDSASANIRFNAATGLARHGNAAAAPILDEMLNYQELSRINLEQQSESPEFDEALRDQLDPGSKKAKSSDPEAAAAAAANELSAAKNKRAVVMINGLRGYVALCEINRMVDRGPLLEAVNRIVAQDEVPAAVRSAAQDLLRGDLLKGE